MFRKAHYLLLQYSNDNINLMTLVKSTVQSVSSSFLLQQLSIAIAGMRCCKCSLYGVIGILLILNVIFFVSLSLLTLLSVDITEM